MTQPQQGLHSLKIKMGASHFQKNSAIILLPYFFETIRILKIQIGLLIDNMLILQVKLERNFNDCYVKKKKKKKKKKKRKKKKKKKKKKMEKKKKIDHSISYQIFFMQWLIPLY